MKIWSKMQIKKQTSCACRLFLLTRILQYISNWSNVLSIYPPFFFNIHRVIIFPIFFDNQFFSWLCRFTYKLGEHFFFYYSWYTSNFETTYKKPPIIKLAIFFWCSFSIKFSWLQRRIDKISTILYDKYYLQNCKLSHLKKL